MALLLAMNVIVTPIYVSFIEEDDHSGFFYCVNLAFDVGFGIDILINFVSAYYNVSGELVTNLREIALNYLRFWFWLDVAAM